MKGIASQYRLVIELQFLFGVCHVYLHRVCLSGNLSFARYFKPICLSSCHSSSRVLHQRTAPRVFRLSDASVCSCTIIDRRVDSFRWFFLSPPPLFVYHHVNVSFSKNMPYTIITSMFHRASVKAVYMLQTIIQ